VSGVSHARPPLPYLACGSLRLEILAPLSCFSVQKKQERRRLKMGSKELYQLRLAILKLRRVRKNLREALKKMFKEVDLK